MTKHFIDQSLLKELRNKKEHCNNSSRYSLRNYIIDEANQHSARIEKPKAIIYDPNVTDSEKSVRLHELEYFQQSLESALEYATQEYSLPIKEAFIKSVAGKIDPLYFEEYSDEILSTKEAPYRRITNAVRPSGAEVTPPYPAKIPFEIAILVKNSNELTGLLKERRLNPVELAAYLHLHLARIHPFPDANGRTSRMIQNLILTKEGYVPATIYEGERRSYHILLNNAIKGYRRRDDDSLFSLSHEEKQFFTFIADKVNVGLDQILDKNGKN